MTNRFAKFDRWADERGYSMEDSAQAFADWLAEKTGRAIIGEECGGDNVVISAPSEVQSD